MPRQPRDLRITTSDGERSVVVHLVVGRSRVVVQVDARAPHWLAFVRLPDSLVLTEEDFRELAAAVHAAFVRYRARFGRRR